MNYVISIINPNAAPTLSSICEELKLPLVLTMPGRGTATATMLDVLGIESNEKRIVMTIASEAKTAAFVKAQKQKLYIDAPNHGIMIAVPVKSVGGGKTLSYLSGGEHVMKAPDLKFDYELVLVVANEGFTDEIMDAAREAGAGGGTVIHAKGTGGTNAEKFFKVSIAQEKELILIVAKAEDKAKIMSAIIEKSGIGKEPAAIAFSLPVSQVEGFMRLSNEEE